MSEIIFRKAEPADVPAILALIWEMAEYEKMTDQVVATEQSLAEWIFEKKLVEVLLADDGGTAVGYALFFQNFSTFEGRAGMYLEDIYVKPSHRKLGLGKKLFRLVAAQAVERGLPRMDWCCLDWNQPSIDFYKSMGAKALDEWTIYRLSGEELQNIGMKE